MVDMRTNRGGPRCTLGIGSHEGLSKDQWEEKSSRQNEEDTQRHIQQTEEDQMAQGQWVMGRVSDEAGEVGRGEQGGAMWTTIEIWDIV